MSFIKRCFVFLECIYIIISYLVQYSYNVNYGQCFPQLSHDPFPWAVAVLNVIKTCLYLMISLINSSVIRNGLFVGLLRCCAVCRIDMRFLVNNAPLWPNNSMKSRRNIEFFQCD